MIDEKQGQGGGRIDNGVNAAKLVFTEKELAQYLGVSYWTVRGWRLQEEDPLPTIGSSGRILYRLQTVEDWMRRSEARSVQNRKAGKAG